MALWICGRPPNQCHPAEVTVAERLGRLNDHWVVAWGYRYAGSGSTGRLREGDFLVQDPEGRICVIEVKSGFLRRFALTGAWEHKEGGNPAEQLAAQVAGVTQRLREVAGNVQPPPVHRALALPDVGFGNHETFRGQLLRSQVIGLGDLVSFESWWRRSVGPAGEPADADRARRLFLDAFGAGATPASVEHFVRETDGLLMRAVASEGRVLRQLADNRQLLIEGGCGTGKTLLALTQALRWAGEGRSVLLLVFNLALAEQLDATITRHPPKAGSVVVHSWEALTLALLDEVGTPMKPPAEPEALRGFWRESVPGRLLAALAEGTLRPRFDALVVDEAQDLDTRLPGGQVADQGPGWWIILSGLLREGWASPVTAFLDQRQRPAFRDPAAFRVEDLVAAFSQPARFRLRATLRYTRPVFDYLAELVPAGGTESEPVLVAPDELREGPEVEEHVVAPGRTAEQARKVLERWVALGLCRPDQVVILGLRRQRVASGLGHLDHLGDIPLVDHAVMVPRGSVPYLNLHRAKGLDWLGVIVIDLPPRTRLVASPEHAEPLANLFAAASRTRQLLAVIAEE